MNRLLTIVKLFGLCLFSLLAFSASAQNFNAQKSGVWQTQNFQFENGQSMPSLKLGYTTLGSPQNEAVLILHGTAGNSIGMLNPAFGGQLFGPGQVLDAQKYYVIIPDALGTGQSSKPSDGMKAQFPVYNYNDMVKAQYLLVKEGLGVKHLRLVLGNSMGGMHAGGRLI
jgi:homoserine O-acetyltransferase